MRIIIYHQSCPALAEETKWHYSCSSILRLQELLDDHPAEDITGYIAKDADQNPDFREMMDRICLRKLKIYEKLRAKNPNTPRIHDEFVDKILKNFSHVYG